ncbi:MAG TPA: hypothetical protein VN611_04780 [Patescibacteria group bacterium]|nr:hypothetical protein [Patescibacteria group bacterium]
MEQVGTRYGTEPGSLPTESVYRFDQRGHRLILMEEKPAADRLREVESGAVELGFYEDGPVIFFLFRFGESKWKETPFSWHLTPRKQQAHPDEVADDQVRILLVDSTDGLIRVVRMLLPSEDFCRRLRQALTKQATGSFNGQSYAKHLNSVWNQLSVEDMVENADSRWRTSAKE